jgi:hypothetical protein
MSHHLLRVLKPRSVTEPAMGTLGRGHDQENAEWGGLVALAGGCFHSACVDKEGLVFCWVGASLFQPSYLEIVHDANIVE